MNSGLKGKLKYKFSGSKVFLSEIWHFLSYEDALLTPIYKYFWSFFFTRLPKHLDKDYGMSPLLLVLINFEDEIGFLVSL